MPMTFYTHDEYATLQRKIADVTAQRDALRQMQPVWVSMQNAWATHTALAQLWHELGVTNQSEAIDRVRELKGTS